MTDPTRKSFNRFQHRSHGIKIPSPPCLSRRLNPVILSEAQRSRRACPERSRRNLPPCPNHLRRSDPSAPDPNPATAQKINSPNHLKKQPKIHVSTPLPSPNLTKPSPPLPISLRHTWHSYPHPRTKLVSRSTKATDPDRFPPSQPSIREGTLALNYHGISSLLPKSYHRQGYFRL